MAKILSSAQMRAIEAKAIAEGRVTGLELMERAGAGVVAAMLEHWPELRVGAFRAAVLCGPGNNGGDGFVVARLLAARGWEVTCYAWEGLARQGGDAGVMRARWLAMGGRLLDYGAFDPVHDGVDVTVDALFGIGMARPLPIGAVNGERVACAHRMVAVDIPTGLLADSGRTIAPAFRADLTVTFHAAKWGHYLDAGLASCGKLVVADIGLPQGPQDWPADAVEVVGAPTGRRLSKNGGHKFDHGHTLVLSGNTGRGGAARLAARAALRVGAGLVTVGCPPDAMAEHAARLDAVMLREVPHGAALTRMLADGRISGLCLGPGLGLGTRQEGLVAAALRAGRRLVLDADALTILSRRADLFGAVHDACVLTPHGGEFARLFPDLAEQMARLPAQEAMSKVDAVPAAARRVGCVVLLKGVDTVIAAPDGRCGVHAAAYGREAPWLATAGAGDVLAGIIAGLMARGWEAFDAACTGASLHVEAARAFGPGLIAEDLPEMLPAVFRRLGV